MLKTFSLPAKLGVVGSVLLLMALASTGLTLWVTWQLEGGAAAVNEAGRLRMQTWRLAQTLAAGDADRLRSQRERFDHSLALLHDGDPTRPLFVPHDDDSRRTLVDVQQGWLALQARWTATPPPGAEQAAVQAEAYVARIDAFVTAIETQLTRWTALLNAFQFVMMALALASAVALLYAAYLFVFNPLARLQAGLSRMAEGDLSARVEVGSDDEFGVLSAGFNDMARTLQGLYQNLESRVQEKTLRLESERARLAALYEAAAFVATATSLDELASGFARQVRRVAQADASAVRWSDESNQRYLLLASDCMPQQVIDAEQCVAAGSCHCGQKQGGAQTRVIAIRPADGTEGVGAAQMPGHCERAGFETVISVPVRLHERMVGELNLFYRSVATLTDEDRVLLEALSSHLAGAIEGLRASALEREAAAAEERGLLARELHDSIAQGLSFQKIQVGLLRDALPLPPDVQVQVLHVVQEALSNVRKHAQAREVWVEVQQAPQWRVEVRDDGRGFAPGTAEADQTHVGLRIMRERAQRIGASVEVVSVPGSGTAVALTLPERQRLAA
ncbi:MAG: type IV pili methyl-accepting chemotaxis transducer N-terminal domain-containing protein [Rubrivivax sp.]|nr:type IV pili methyl-accepting chemotaxis transducer N-terminal domain-containing protein [Rubrivivax sp.]